MNDRWFFGLIPFRRLVTDDDSRFFVSSLATSIDVTAAIAPQARRIIDVGGIVYEPLTFVALCDTLNEAQSFQAAIGTVQTLKHPRGDSLVALLTQATRLVENGLGYRVRCTFELVI
jgi:hypothetical protein